MSLSLDIVLYLRDKKLENPLTLSERAVLITLAFRVGSNPFAWISQASLAIELDISECNVRIHCKNLQEKGFLIIENDIKDKRKNIYRIAEFLINYHQNGKRFVTKKYRSKSIANSKNTDRNQSVFTDRNQSVINCTNSDQEIDNYNEIIDDINPKATDESNIKKKDILCISKKERLKTFPDSFEADEKNESIAHKYNLHLSDELEKFKDYNLAKGNKYINWHSAFNNWLRNAKRYAENSKGMKNDYQQLSYAEQLKYSGEKLKELRASSRVDSEDFYEI